MRLEWSIFAQGDRDAIFDYIEQDSPRAAITVDNRIRVQIENLAQFPKRGRPGRVEGTLELFIQRTPNIAAYRIAGDKVRILRILHGAQRDGPTICLTNYGDLPGDPGPALFEAWDSTAQSIKGFCYFAGIKSNLPDPSS